MRHKHDQGAASPTTSTKPVPAPLTWMRTFGTHAPCQNSRRAAHGADEPACAEQGESCHRDQIWSLWRARAPQNNCRFRSLGRFAAARLSERGRGSLASIYSTSPPAGATRPGQTTCTSLISSDQHVNDTRSLAGQEHSLLSAMLLGPGVRPRRGRAAPRRGEE